MMLTDAHLIVDGSGDEVALQLERRPLPQDRGDLARIDVGAAHLLQRQPRRRYQDGVEGPEPGSPLVHRGCGGAGGRWDVLDRAAQRYVCQGALLDRPRAEPALL